jgi:hypothetical protein
MSSLNIYFGGKRIGRVYSYGNTAFVGLDRVRIQPAVRTINGILIPDCGRMVPKGNCAPFIQVGGDPGYCDGSMADMILVGIVGFAGGGGGGGAPAPPAKPDCNALTAAAGVPGLTYTNATQIWNDGGFSTYSTDAEAATVAGMAAVTWLGESSFSLNPINNPNRNGSGQITSVDYGPFQINQRFHPNSDASVWGTNGGGQVFNGNPDSNITFGISILKGLYQSYGDNAPGRYVGSLGNRNGQPINPNAQNREAAWQKYRTGLTNLFSIRDCFPRRSRS